MSHAVYYVGDVLEVLAKLPEDSVDLVLTSPPFLALRSYLPADHPDKAKEGGQERTPGEFIDWLLDVVEACDRVLAPHGSMCIELGDTFAGSGGAGGDYGEDGLREGQPEFEGSGRRGAPSVSPDGQTGHYTGRQLRPYGPNAGHGWPPPKSLTLIPETFRFALAYGFNPHTGRTTAPWRIRNVVRWVRPNPPVGSLGDKFRPATSEMVVFCRTDEAGRKRYFDIDSVRGGVSEWTQRYVDQIPVSARAQDSQHQADRVRAKADEGLSQQGAPPLDWWEIPTEGFPGAHYATWPRMLCVKPIKAMSPERVCRTCGEPSRRVVEVEGLHGKDILAIRSENDRGVGLQGARPPMPTITRTTTGWTSCGHDDDRPGVILDPFGGSGTTGAVAVGHGRDAVLIDLDDRNVELARERIGPLFFEEGVLERTEMEKRIDMLIETKRQALELLEAGVHQWPEDACVGCGGQGWREQPNLHTGDAERVLCECTAEEGVL